MDDPDDVSWIWDHVLNGRTDQAIERYLQYRAGKPLASNLRRHKRYFKSLYGPVCPKSVMDAKISEGLSSSSAG